MMARSGDGNCTNKPSAMNVHLPSCVDGGSLGFAHKPSGGAEGFIPQVVVGAIRAVVQVADLEGIVAMAPECHQVTTHALSPDRGWDSRVYKVPQPGNVVDYEVASVAIN